MNVISIGCQCWNAMTLRKLKILEKSLPFDNVSSNLSGILKILTQEASVKDFLTIEKNSQDNKLGFWLGHFLPTEENKQPINYNELESLFERRISRLLDYFYNRSNVLIYNNLSKRGEKYEEDIKILEKIIDLNKQNKILFLSRKDFLFPDYSNPYITIEYSDFSKLEPDSIQSKLALDFIERICFKYFLN